MAIDPQELYDALKLIDPVLLAQLNHQSKKMIEDSEQIGNSLISVLKQMQDMVDQFINLRNMAITAEGKAIFDERMNDLILAIQTKIVLNTTQKLYFQPIINALMK